MTHNFFARSSHSFFIQSPHGFRDTISGTPVVFINNGTTMSAYGDDLTTLFWQAGTSHDSFAIGVDETVFCVSIDGSDTIVRQLRCSDGVELWRTSALADDDAILTTDATRLYLVADQGASSELQKWNPGTGLVWSSPLSFAPVMSKGIAVDLSGNTFLLSLSGSTAKMHKIDSSGTEVTTGGWPVTITFTFSTQGKPRCDSGGNVFFIDTPSAIKKLDTSGSSLWSLSPPSTYNWLNLFLDGDDNLYGIATKTGSQTLVAYDGADPPNQQWSKTFSNSVADGATDADGNVYVTAPMFKYDSAGTLLNSSAAGGNVIDVLPGRAPHFQ